MATKVRDLNKTICGLIFQPYFLYGLLQIIFFLTFIVCCFLMINSDEPVFLKIVFCALAVFFGFLLLIEGIKKIKMTWKDWRDYLKDGE